MAVLRRRFGSAFEFERARGLPARSVSDVLRGRPNSRITKAIEQELTNNHSAESQSDLSDSSDHQKLAHRINAEAR